MCSSGCNTPTRYKSMIGQHRSSGALATSMSNYAPHPSCHTLAPFSDSLARVQQIALIDQVALVMAIAAMVDGGKMLIVCDSGKAHTGVFCSVLLACARTMSFDAAVDKFSEFRKLNHMDRWSMNRLVCEHGMRDWSWMDLGKHCEVMVSKGSLVVSDEVRILIKLQYTLLLKTGVLELKCKSAPSFRPIGMARLINSSGNNVSSGVPAASRSRNPVAALTTPPQPPPTRRSRSPSPSQSRSPANPQAAALVEERPPPIPPKQRPPTPYWVGAQPPLEPPLPVEHPPPLEPQPEEEFWLHPWPRPSGAQISGPTLGPDPRNGWKCTGCGMCNLRRDMKCTGCVLLRPLHQESTR